METPTKITFCFKKDENYRLIPVNGVWGGPTPRGDIRVDLFHESLSLPEVITQAVTPDAKLGKELERTPANTVQRNVMVGMILTAEQAESIGRWLQEKAREVRAGAAEKGGYAGERDILTTQ